MYRPSIVSIPLLALLAACEPSASGSPGPAGGNAIPLEGACDAMRSTLCDRYAGCGLIAAEHAGACEEGLFSCENFGFDRDVRAGRMTYDGAALRRCLTALASAPCVRDGWQQVFSVDADCRAAFRGAVPVGGECDGGTVCESGWCNEFECPGGCIETRGSGAACGPGQPPCAPHLGCVAGTCGELPGAGQPCTQDDEWDGRCAPGLVCDETGTCRAYAVAGEPCLEGDEEYALPGVPCAEGFACEAGRCVALGGEGDACDWTWDCRMDLRCAAGRCAPRLGEGGDCTSDNEACDLGLWCLSSGTCGLPLRAGASCDEESDDCRDWCEGGVCVEEVGPGQACDDVTRFCYSGPCVEGSCTTDCSDW
jgi:hypothetical protein